MTKTMKTIFKIIMWVIAVLFVLFVIVPFVLAAVVSGALSSLIAVLNWQTLFTLIFIGLTIFFVIKIFD